MANTINLSTDYQRAVDFKFRKGTLTSGMVVSEDFATSLGENGNVNLMEVAVSGFGNYSRTTGYAAGDTTVTWRPYTLAVERSKQIAIDRMDDEQTMNMAFASAITEFQDGYALPEIDAYRFAKLYASANSGNIATPATLTAATALQAFDDAEEKLNEAGVPLEGRKLYVSNEVYKFLKQSSLITRNVQADSTNGSVNRSVWTLDNGIPVVNVQRSRFYTQVTLLTSGAFGYEKTATTGRDLNFILVHEPSIKAVVALNKIKIFGADVNQSSDSNLYQIRMFHDLIVPENKRDAIYIHNKAS